MSQRLIYTTLLMFFSPAFTLFRGLKSSSTRYKRWLLTIFVTFFGSLIFLSESNDGFRHRANVYSHYVDLSFGQFLKELINILLFKQNATLAVQEEPYIHILSYLVGGVLGLPGLFFVFVAFIYGYFFSGAIFRLFERAPTFKLSWLFYGFATLFVLWKNLEGINTVRTWTGLWVLFYAALSYFETRKLKYLLLVFVPPMIHIGYFAMAMPTWLVLLFGSYPRLYTALFILSFVSPVLNQNTVLKQLERTEVGANKVRGYYVEDKQGASDVLSEYGGSTWYLQLYKLGLQNYGLTGIVVLLFLFGIYTRFMNPAESHLFSAGVLTLILSNSAWFLSALQNRSAIVAGLFILGGLLLPWQRGVFREHLHGRRKKLFNAGLLLVFTLFVPFFIYRGADMIYYLSAFLFVAPIIPWISPETNLSIREAIGFFLGE